MTWLRQEVGLICLAVLLGRFVMAREISGWLILGIVVLAIAVVAEDYIPLPDSPRDFTEEALAQLRTDLEAQISDNQKKIMKHEGDTAEKLKELKNAVSSATLAAGLRPKQLNGEPR